MLIEICAEFNLALWTCTVDYEKAFDSVEHGVLWSALLEQGVDSRLVAVLMALYNDQMGYIRVGVLSKPFKIEGGIKQGDPMSPILFTSGLERVIGPLQTRWWNKEWGVHLGDAPVKILTKRRFANGVLLLASSRQKLWQMLGDLSTESAKVGSKIHMGKTWEDEGFDKRNRGSRKAQSA